MTRLTPLIAILLFCAGLFCLAQAPSRAQGWLPLGQASGGSSVLTFENGYTVSSSGSTSVDFGTVSYTSGCTEQVIIVGGLVQTGTFGVTSVTMNSASGTEVPSALVTDSSVGADVWTASPSGSSGDLTIVFSTAMWDHPVVGLYCLQTTHSTPGTPVTNQNSSTSIATTISVPSGGSAVSIAYTQSGASTVSWTGATGNYQQFGGGGQGGGPAVTSTSGSQTLTATFNHSNINVMTSVAWQP
jgi:hypothetical protein